MNENSDLMFSLINYNKYRRYCYLNGVVFEKDKKLESLLSSRYQKISRIKKRFIYLVNRYKNLYFCTFTLDDYYLNCSDRTRKDLIKDSLYSFDDDIKYIINVDFGRSTERLHYHGIIATNSDLNLKNYLDLVYPCFSYTEPIRISSDDIKRTSKYINKLTNHAVKDSTNRFRVLYNFKGYDIFKDNYAHVLYFYDCLRIGLT